MAKIIGAKWRKLDKRSRRYCDRLAMKEMRKFGKAMECYNMEVEITEGLGGKAKYLRYAWLYS